MLDMSNMRGQTSRAKRPLGGRVSYPLRKAMRGWCSPRIVFAYGLQEDADHAAVSFVDDFAQRFLHLFLGV